MYHLISIINNIFCHKQIQITNLEIIFVETCWAYFFGFTNLLILFVKLSILLGLSAQRWNFSSHPVLLLATEIASLKYLLEIIRCRKSALLKTFYIQKSQTFQSFHLLHKSGNKFVKFSCAIVFNVHDAVFNVRAKVFL